MSHIIKTEQSAGEVLVYCHIMNMIGADKEFKSSNRLAKYKCRYFKNGFFVIVYSIEAV